MCIYIYDISRLRVKLQTSARNVPHITVPRERYLEYGTSSGMKIWIFDGRERDDDDDDDATMRHTTTTMYI